MKIVSTSIIAAVLFFAGCATTEIVQNDYVEADRATYEAVAPSYLQYVQGDSALSKEEKTRRERTIKTWRLRLEQAEKPVQPTAEEK
ncbi:MAG: hypothetical protein AB7L09_00080 [Nitrospira sp.]